MSKALRASALVLTANLFTVMTHCAQAWAAGLDPTGRTERDGVVTTYKKDGDVEYVVGQIRLRQPAEQVWAILSNPYEFQEKISPRFKTEALLVDRQERSVMRCRVDLNFLFPPIKYVVESRYEPTRRITFNSLSGDLKQFKGSWELTPLAGNQTLVTYSLHVVPGIPIPQWIVRQGVKMELPHTLIGLKKRLDAIAAGKERPVARRIAATGTPIR